MNSAPDGISDSSMYPNLFAALIEDNTYTWTDEDLGKLASGNILRVFQEVEVVRDVLVQETPYQRMVPIEDFEAGETGCMSEVD